jgi:predicted Zn-dependent protease
MSVSRTLRRSFCFVCLFCFTSRVPLLAAGEPVSPVLDSAMDRLYNFDFPGAHRILDEWQKTHPQDPVGFALQGAAYMFGEFARLQILDGEFFEDDKQIASKKKLKYDAKVRDEFYAQLNHAQALAQQQLLKNPDDQNALFAETMSNGMLTDYVSLVEKRGLASLSYAKEGQVYALRLLKINPTFYDAYLTTGFTEYLVGSLPFFVKWFVHFDDTQGSKQAAIQNLEKVAQDGYYLKPFSKILLAIIYLRADQPARSEQLLNQLVTEFPENPLLRKEQTRVRGLVQTQTVKS